MNHVFLLTTSYRGREGNFEAQFVFLVLLCDRTRNFDRNQYYSRTRNKVGPDIQRDQDQGPRTDLIWDWDQDQDQNQDRDHMIAGTWTRTGTRTSKRRKNAIDSHHNKTKTGTSTRIVTRTSTRIGTGTSTRIGTGTRTEIGTGTRTEIKSSELKMIGTGTDH